MTDADIAGAEVIRWLDSPDADPNLLIGCGFDDGDCEDLLPVVAVDLGARRITYAAAAGTRSVPFARLADGVVVPSDALRAAVLAATPASLREENAAYDEIRDVVPHRPPSREDLLVILDAVRDHRRGLTPDRDTRHLRAKALKRSGAWTAGVAIAAGWREAAIAAGVWPQGDVAIHLARFQREAKDARGSLATLADLRFARPALNERQRAIIATMEGAAHADLYEAQRRNAEHLERAFACAAQAWAIAPKDEEANALYQRLHALTPKRP
ncbi:hypothetical protein LJR164_002314 [Phenylobacterium sp. LjRoot164]|uniref:hypothetical protein n=1 Tax=unclassified Phenylobacterium TaxID=2640670 RepID=UPI003ECD47B0